MGDPIPQVEVSDHVMVLPYSSGATESSPRRDAHPLQPGGEHCADGARPRLTDNRVGLSALPFFHIYGMQVLMNGMLTNGVTVLTMARFDMEQALELVAEHKVTRFFAVPPMVLGLAKAPIVDQYDLSSVKQVFSGAAPLTVELQNECAERINCEVVQGFGMTELSPVTHCTPEGRNKPHQRCCGQQCRDRIVDPETGEDQPVGERGELWVRGPMVMKGYLNNPEATAETIDAEGWLHTGDVAIVDEDGYFSIVDRIKELIKYNGFQVPPAELEGLIATHPKVLDVAVIGVPDDAAGELPKAFVQLAPGADLTLSRNRRRSWGEHLVSYKQIRDGGHRPHPEERLGQDPAPRTARPLIIPVRG